MAAGGRKPPPLHTMWGPCWHNSSTSNTKGGVAGRVVVYKYNELPRQVISRLTQDFRKMEASSSPQRNSEILTYTACIVRNPIDRLISAWKSKLACGRPHGQHHAESATLKFGTDVNDTQWLLPPLLGGISSSKATTMQLVREMRGKKCVKFEHLLTLLDAHRSKDVSFGNEHLSLQTSVCKIRMTKSYYRDTIPMEDLSVDMPPALVPLAKHLGVNLAVYPYLHTHKSASVVADTRQRTLAKDADIPHNIKMIMLKIESIAREDVAILGSLVSKEYAAASALAASHVIRALNHDNGVEET